MCHGCFSQLFLRDEFYSGGMAGLLGKAAGMPTRRAFMAYSVAAASALTAVGAAPAFAADEGADLILRGGTIRPLPGAPVCLGARDQGRQSACGWRRERAVGPQDGRYQGRRSCRPHAAARAHRSALPHAARLADLRTARRRRLRQISDPRKTRSASESRSRRARQKGNGSSAPISTIFCKAGISRGRNWMRFQPTIRFSSGTPMGTTPASTAKRLKSRESPRM